ncbi:hypothetical protein ABF228_001383 [Yersinia ruckeri]|nr:hypothetical protein [Yersinia ruckeri]
MPKKNRILIKFWEVTELCISSFRNLYNSKLYDEFPKKIFVLLAIFHVLAKVTYFVAYFRLPILFLLPMIMGLMVAHYVYPTKGVLLKNLNDSLLYAVASLSAGVLVLNSAKADINFFQQYMVGFWGYVSSTAFCFFTTIKFYIALKDTYNVKMKKNT